MALGPLPAANSSISQDSGEHGPCLPEYESLLACQYKTPAGNKPIRMISRYAYFRFSRDKSRLEAALPAAGITDAAARGTVRSGAAGRSRGDHGTLRTGFASASQASWPLDLQRYGEAVAAFDAAIALNPANEIAREAREQTLRNLQVST
jgi:hypothetical protein